MWTDNENSQDIGKLKKDTKMKTVPRRDKLRNKKEYWPLLYALLHLVFLTTCTHTSVFQKSLSALTEKNVY